MNHGAAARAGQIPDGEAQQRQGSQNRTQPVKEQQQVRPVHRGDIGKGEDQHAGNHPQHVQHAQAAFPGVISKGRGDFLLAGIAAHPARQGLQNIDLLGGGQRMGESQKNHGNRSDQGNDPALSGAEAALFVLGIHGLAALLPGVSDFTEGHFIFAQARAVHIHDQGADEHDDQVQRCAHREAAELQRAANDQIQEREHEVIRHQAQPSFHRRAVQKISFQVRLKYQRHFVLCGFGLILHDCFIPRFDTQWARGPSRPAAFHS